MGNTTNNPRRNWEQLVSAAVSEIADLDFKRHAAVAAKESLRELEIDARTEEDDEGNISIIIFLPRPVITPAIKLTVQFASVSPKELDAWEFVPGLKFPAACEYIFGPYAPSPTPYEIVTFLSFLNVLVRRVPGFRIVKQRSPHNPNIKVFRLVFIYTIYNNTSFVFVSGVIAQEGLPQTRDLEEEKGEQPLKWLWRLFLPLRRRLKKRNE